MIFVQTNDAGANAVVAFDAALARLGAFPTGGRGTGEPHLPSQGSLVVAGHALLVANAGSGDVSGFEVGADGLTLAGRWPSGGERPVSIAAHGSLAYVLNGGAAPAIAGFTRDGARLTSLDGSQRLLADGSDPAQVAFSPDGRALVVTERGTNAITVFPVGEDGLPGEPSTQASAGATPYGFDFANGVLVVTEAFGGRIGEAAASSYRLDGARLTPISPSVGDTRSEVCWAVASADGRVVWVTNFGDGSISRYSVSADGSLALADAVAASTVLGEKGLRDAARSADGSHLYALDADARRVFAWRVGDEGRLEPVGDADGLPATVAGLAAA